MENIQNYPLTIPSIPKQMNDDIIYCNVQKLNKQSCRYYKLNKEDDLPRVM